MHIKVEARGRPEPELLICGKGEEMAKKRNSNSSRSFLFSNHLSIWTNLLYFSFSRQYPSTNSVNFPA